MIFVLLEFTILSTQRALNGGQVTVPTLINTDLLFRRAALPFAVALDPSCAALSWFVAFRARLTVSNRRKQRTEGKGVLKSSASSRLLDVLYYVAAV